MSETLSSFALQVLSLALRTAARQPHLAASPGSVSLLPGGGTGARALRPTVAAHPAQPRPPRVQSAWRVGSAAAPGSKHKLEGLRPIASWTTGRTLSGAKHRNRREGRAPGLSMSSHSFFFFFKRSRRQARKRLSSQWGRGLGTLAEEAYRCGPPGRGASSRRVPAPRLGSRRVWPRRLGRPEAQRPRAAHAGAKPALSELLSPQPSRSPEPSCHASGPPSFPGPGRGALFRGFFPRGARTRRGASPVTPALGLPRPAQRAPPEGIPLREAHRKRARKKRVRKKEKRGASDFSR